ncbi:helix-turn-helix domain-containing protein [Novosphingobium sp. B1]|jgi:DNA-binding MarR family transcriptional regulator|uniref:MarR family transcriptional regulator n=1 Tax=Novosphingobium sp. B1 TaxID=1938756 RepID=UPI0015934DBC|nr:helix-turn-helix domain-containing protein [Novosphingobium sp. B1]
MEQFDRQKVADVAHMLLRFSSEDSEAIFAGAGSTAPLTAEARVIEEQVRRRNRAKLLGVESDIFSDPAWDLLLELFVARLRNQRLSASVIGIEAGIPQSTALRWLSYLCNLGLVERSPDPEDKRRHWVRLGDRAFSALSRCFS